MLGRCIIKCKPSLHCLESLSKRMDLMYLSRTMRTVICQKEKEDHGKIFSKIIPLEKGASGVAQLMEQLLEEIDSVLALALDFYAFY